MHVAPVLSLGAESKCPLNLSFQRQLPGVPERSSTQPEKQHHHRQQTQRGAACSRGCESVFRFQSLTSFLFVCLFFLTGPFITCSCPQHQASSDQTSKTENYFVSHKMEDYLIRVSTAVVSDPFLLMREGASRTQLIRVDLLTGFDLV